MNILFINGCIRGKKSRTLRLAKAFLSEFSDENVEEVNLDLLEFLPLTSERLAKRDEYVLNKNFDHAEFEPAKQFKKADLIVLAAPFWEGTFPSVVHAYLESVCVSGLTFELGRNGYNGLCKAKEAVFFTTRGGVYEQGIMQNDEHAKGVLRTIFKMLGINKTTTVEAEGLDIKGADVEEIMAVAKNKATSLAKTIIDKK